MKHKNKKVNTPTLASNNLTNLVTTNPSYYYAAAASCVRLLFIALFTFKSLLSFSQRTAQDRSAHLFFLFCKMNVRLNQIQNKNKSYT